MTVLIFWVKRLFFYPMCAYSYFLLSPLKHNILAVQYM